MLRMLDDNSTWITRSSRVLASCRRMSPILRAWRREVLAGVSVVFSKSEPARHELALYPGSVKEDGRARTRAAADPDRAQAALSAPVPVTVLTPDRVLGCGRTVRAVVCSLVVLGRPTRSSAATNLSIRDRRELVIWSTSPALALGGCSGWPTRRCGPAVGTVIRHATPSADRRCRLGPDREARPGVRGLGTDAGLRGVIAVRSNRPAALCRAVRAAF